VGLFANTTRQHALQHLDLPLLHQQFLLEARLLSVELLPLAVEASHQILHLHLDG
jgi:hypothetical protein